MCDVSVVIPSYGRPQELRRCLAAVEALIPEPLEIMVVLRPDDGSSRLVAGQGDERVRVVDVNGPGHLPPLSAGLAAARGEVMAVLDDDAVPRPNWLRCIRRAFSHPHVVGLGGPVAEHPCRLDGNTRIDAGRTAVRMRLLRGRTWYRGFCALPDPELCRHAGLEGPVPADLVLGGNMAFRRRVLERIGIDQGLNTGAAINYEADLALGARRFGTVLFDPALIVDHYPATRIGAPSRTAEERYRQDYTYNLHYVAGKHFSTSEAVLFDAYMALVGQGVSPGLVRRLLSRPGRDGLLWNAHDTLAAARTQGRQAGRAAREAASIGDSTVRRESVS